MTSPAAVCIGESMGVLLPGGPGPLELVDSYRATVGGAESNVAYGLAGLGVPTAWLSRVGDDGFGRRLLTGLAARGVDVSAVAIDPTRPTGLYVKETGARTRMHYYRAGSAASAMGPELLAEPGVARLLAGARLLHLSGITPALSDSCLELVRTLLTAGRRGRLVSFDLNWRPALWRHPDPAVLAELAARADVLLLGADEAKAVFGVGDPAGLRARFPDPETIVVKDAGHRATVIRRDGTTVTEPALSVEIVEPTGAGDGFAAGYLAGRLERLDERSCLRLGHLLAAHALVSTEDHGVPLPRRAITALLAASACDWARVRVTPGGIERRVSRAL